MTGRHRLHAGAVSAVLQHQAELMRCTTVKSAKRPSIVIEDAVLSAQALRILFFFQTLKIQYMNF